MLAAAIMGDGQRGGPFAGLFLALVRAAQGDGPASDCALTLLLLLADYAGLPLLGQIAGGIFLACAGLELFFDYCIGCRIYVWIRKIRFGGE
jgi:hypothetical protein